MIRRLITGNVLVAVLLAATVLMQAGIMYRQSTARAQAVREQVREAPAGTVIDVRGMPVLGSNKAKVVLVEFSDYECPFCRRHATSVFPEIKKTFVDTGRIRYIFANNPLAMHPNAPLLAAAALCAGDQGHYWELHERLFEKQPKTLPDVLSIVEGSKIDASALERCATDQAIKKRVQQDVAIAGKLGLNGTPGFAVGRLGSDGRIAIDHLVSGAQSFETFENVIKKSL